MPFVTRIAHAIGFLPLVWLLGLYVRRQRCAGAWWWLGIVFSVSGLTDFLSLVIGHPLASRMYPVGQAGMAAIVLLSQGESFLCVTLLVVVGMVGALMAEYPENDILVHTIAWGSVAAIAYRIAPSLLRRSLLVYFGLGVVGWWLFTLTPTVLSWTLYQSTRLVGILFFCGAAQQSCKRQAA